MSNKGKGARRHRRAFRTVKLGKPPPAKTLSGKRARFRRAYDAELKAIEPLERTTTP